MRFTKDFLPELDGLRALAVGLVLWSHVPTDALPAPMVELGHLLFHHYLGVDLFFVLSGFLITRILLVDRELGVPLRHFLARRFLRIFPIYYLLLAVLAVVRWEPAIPWAAVYLGNYYVFWTQAYGLLDHTWSLCVEEHFYLLWPPVCAALAPRASRRVLLLVFLPLAVATGVVLAWRHGSFEQRQFLAEVTGTGSTGRFGSLAAGALLAYSERALRAHPWRATALAALLAALSWVLSEGGFQRTGLWRIVLWTELQGDPMRILPTLRLISFPLVSSAVLLLLVVWSGSRAPHAALMRTAPLRFVGRISYGIYLYHYPLYYALRVRHPDHEAPSPVHLVGAIAAVVLVSWISWVTIERPLVRFADRFRKPVSAAPVGASPPPSPRG